MTGGSAILGYTVEMARHLLSSEGALCFKGSCRQETCRTQETDLNPGWTTIYDGSLDPNVKQSLSCRAMGSKCFHFKVLRNSWTLHISASVDSHSKNSILGQTLQYVAVFL